MKVGVHQGSALSPLLFTIVVDVITESVRNGLISEMCLISEREFCEEMETVRGFCYLGDGVNAGGGCEAAVTAKARIGWGKFRECGELMHSKRFSLKLKGMVYKSCVRLAMLYESETLCLRENEMAIFERAMVRAICGVKQREKKRTKDLMEM